MPGKVSGVAWKRTEPELPSDSYGCGSHCRIVLGITRMEWMIIILCIGVVIAAELFNTAIEKLVDLVSPQQHPVAGQVKDIAAGAVLVCAATAAIIGLIVFIPYLTRFFL